MPRTHFPDPVIKDAMQELLELERTVRMLSEKLELLERSARISALPPAHGHRPVATLSAITIGGVQQPFFASDQFGPLCFDSECLEKEFLAQLHLREAEAGGVMFDDDHCTPQDTASLASKTNLTTAERVTMSYFAPTGLVAASSLRVHQPRHQPPHKPLRTTPPHMPQLVPPHMPPHMPPLMPLHWREGTDL